MYKWLLAILLASSCIFGLIVLVAETPQSAEELAKEDANKLKFVATDFQFDKTEYHVKKGSTLTVELNSKQGVHGLGIPDLGIDLQGDKLTQEVTFDKAGTFDVHCSVMCGLGHADMVAKLIVE